MVGMMERCFVNVVYIFRITSLLATVAAILKILLLQLLTKKIASTQDITVNMMCRTCI